MGLFGNKTAPEKAVATKSKGDHDHTAVSASGGDNHLNEDAQEIIKDNMDIMHDIVMQIRDDPDFARGIYADCPRLQHMLEERPDLRPVFEDPYLVRLNFEQVYRDQGGVLPEDEPKKPSCLSKIVNSPLFKILKVFLFIKKIMNCFMGGGISMIKGCFAGLCFDEAADMVDGGDPDGNNVDGDGDDPNPANKANREALNKAAEHMEDPEVREQMQDLLENDPEGLADAIEDDPELKALRDSNPLCAELMSDPETMKILTEPDNLRGLAEAPDLIAQDFMDPDWAPDDVELGEADQRGGGLYSVDEMGVDEIDEYDDVGDYDDYGEYNDNFDLENDDYGEGQGEENIGEDFEVGETEEDAALEDEEGNLAEDFELGEAEEGNNNAGKGANKSKNQQQKKDQSQKQGGGGGGFFSQIGAGITDMLAAELVGVGISEITGGGDDFPIEDDIPTDQVEGAAESATAVEDAAAQAGAIASAGEVLMSDDLADNLDNLEDGMDEIEGTADEQQADQDDRRAERAHAAGAGAAGGFAAGGMGGSREKEGEEDEDAEEEDKPKKGRFAFIGNMASAISTAAKEHVATALLGDDFGEMLVEKVEEDDEEGDEESTRKGDDKLNAKSTKVSDEHEHSISILDGSESSER